MGPAARAREHAITIFACYGDSRSMEIPDQPYQPRHASFPNVSFGKTAPKLRSFQAVWFDNWHALAPLLGEGLLSRLCEGCEVGIRAQKKHIWFNL